MKEYMGKILKETMCRIGGHVFLSFGSVNENSRCDCGLYTYGEYLAGISSAQQGVPAESLPPAANDVEDDAWVKGTQIP